MIDLSGLPFPPGAPPAGACVRIERPEPGLAVIVFDPPQRSLAVFDLPLLIDFDAALAAIEHDASVRGLLITGRDATQFAAGADLDALGALCEPELVRRIVDAGQKLFERVAALSRTRPGFVSVAAIGGAAPGGACELALACDWIVLTNSRSTRIGLPETQLGILPAWGGCERLPRKIGVTAALEAILSGKLYTAREARRLGLADRVTNAEDLRAVASAIALGRERLVRRSRTFARVFVDRNPLAASFIASQAEKRVLARTHGHYPALLAALRVTVRAPRTPLELGFAAEAAAASELAVGPVAKNLIRLFQLSDAAKKQKRLPDGISAALPMRIGVLGAGVMGRGIASLCAERGFWTRLYDIAPAALDVALFEHQSAIAEKRKRRRLEPSEAERAIDHLDVTRALDGFARVDIVIEAVAEKLEVKRAAFAALALQVGPDAILATNTSSLSVAALAAGLPHPERIVGLHFFNPVKAMPLVEIVRGPETSAAVVARCAALALELGKTPVIVRDVAGFLVNRLLGPYLDEALRLFEGGIDPQGIESAALGFGMPMGPLALLDEVGFDIATHAAASLYAAYGERMTPSRVLAGFVLEQRLGKKSGKGFYVHPTAAKGRRTRARPVLAGDLARFVPAGAARIGLLTREAITDRLLFAMLCEGVRALEDGVVASAREVDLATVFGMGFPPFRGGLLCWADALGAKELTIRIEAIARAQDVRARGGASARFATPELVVRLARTLERFDGN